MKVSLLGQKYFCRNLLNFAKIGRISPNFGRNWPNFPDFGLFKKRPLSIYSLFKSFFEQLVAVLKIFSHFEAVFGLKSLYQDKKFYFGQDDPLKDEVSL